MEARYFHRDALPEDLDTGRVSRDDIEPGFEARANPLLPTYFQNVTGESGRNAGEIIN